MLYVISGSAASGKKTVAKAVVARLSRLEAHHDNERFATTGEERVANLDLWIGDAIRMEEDGVDLLFATQAPLGEVLAAPRAVEVEGIAPLLLDCHDFTRWERLHARGIDPAWPPNIDTLCWAVFHRMHARDPQWESRICTDRDCPGARWDRWLSWSADDPRWCVKIHDSTDEDVAATTRAVTAWIEGVRASGTPLARDRRWWEDPAD